MALMSAPTGIMRPTALVLNILVTAIALVRFARARMLSNRARALGCPSVLSANPERIVSSAARTATVLVSGDVDGAKGHLSPRSG